MKFEDPWDIDSEYQSREYVLSGGQRAFIATGDSPYEGTSTPTDRIRKKAQQLPNRIQDLIDDVALLAYGNHLQATTWEDIRNVDGRAKGVHHPADFFFTQPENANPDIQFGFEIGSLMYALSQTADGNPDWQDFIWGVILGFVGGKPGDEGVEAKAVESFIETIRERTTKRSHLSPREQSGIDFLLQRNEQRREAIKSVLERNEITPVNELVSLIRACLRERGDPPVEKRVQKFIETEIEYSRLKRVDNIYQKVIADADSIIEEGFPTSNVTAREMLRPVWEMESPTSQQVAEEAGYSSSASGLATGVLDRLSQTEGKEPWTTHPIVEGDQGGWTMTAYGTLVGEILFESDAYQPETPLHERKSAVEWLYEYGLAAEKVDEDRRTLMEKLQQEITLDNS